MLKRLLFLSFVLIIVIVISAMTSCGNISTENIGSLLDNLADKLDAAEKEINDAVDSIKQDTGDLPETEVIEVITNPPETGSPEPETDISVQNPKSESGFEIYENQYLGFKIQYPIEWMYIDGGISAEDFNAMILDVFGQDAADLFNQLGADPSTVTLMWYDFGNAGEYFVPNANLGISDAEGITQNDLKSPLNITELQNTFDEYYALIFQNFKSGGMAGKAMGGNYFAVYKFDYLINDIISLSCYQAMTEKNGLLYMFTFTTHRGASDAAVYEKMLSTLEFY